MTDPTFTLDRIDSESARIVCGSRILGTLNWTDSFWALEIPGQKYVAYPDCDTLDDLDIAFMKAVSEQFQSDDASKLDFFLDPPTFVGPGDGSRACWIYTAWKLITQGKSADPNEWSGPEYAAANAIYRRVRRKYGDSPPDKTDAIKEVQAR